MISDVQAAGSARRRVVWQAAFLPMAVVAVVVGFALLIWLGHRGLDSVVTETRQIVGENLDGSVRMSEIARQLQTINAALYGLMTARAAGTEGVEVGRELDALGGQVARLRADLTDYRTRLATPSQGPAIAEALEALEQYEGAVRWVGSMLEIDFASAVSFLRPFTAMFDRVSGRFDEITAAAVEGARNRAELAAASANSTVLGFIVVTLLAALATSGVAWLAGRHQQKLRVTAETLERLVAERTRELAQRTADLEVSLASLREAQATLVMQEKMASLGGLVAGVAHEINTPIGVALTGATMLTDRAEDLRERLVAGRLRKSELDSFLSTVAGASDLLRSNIERAAQLVQTFKMVSADRTSEARRPFDLRVYLSDVLTSLGPAYRKVGHVVHLDCPEGVEIDGYPGILAQVISNFVMNSLIHGFEDGFQGTISLAVAQPDPDIIELVYTDNGKGISPENRERVFDPFFTTKRGEGCTGLGLHIVYNLVTARLGGEVRLDGGVGEGVRFCVRFARIAPT